MAETVRLSIHVATGMTTRPISGAVTVVGAPDQFFGAALAQAVIAQIDPLFSDRLVGIIWNDPDYPERLQMLFPRDMTLAAVQNYFGAEATAEPPTIHVDDGGYGGGGELISY